MINDLLVYGDAYITLKIIKENKKEKEFLEMLNSIMYDDLDLNEWLSYYQKSILIELGIGVD